MPANYDNAAWFYDRLSRLVFGNTLVKAYTALLHYIPVNSRILIAGGGTGQIIEDIGNIHSSGLELTYVELSEKMTALAKKRYSGTNSITYINAAVEDAELTPYYDIIITPFLLDSLPADVLTKVFSRLNGVLKPGGLWLNTDFQLTGKWWQPVLLKTMFVFFKIIGCVEVTALPLIRQQFDSGGYTIIEERFFYGSFMVTIGYKKP